MSTGVDTLKVYYCYAKQDEELRDQLTAHLSALRRERRLTIWLDVEIQAGADWRVEVEKQLKEADIVLLLISADFMASDYCYNLQLTTALNHYEAGKLDIIPILLRPFDWRGSVIERLPLILPTTRREVTLWENRDEAFKNIAVAIRDVIQAKISSRRTLSSSEITFLNQLGERALEARCPQCGTPNRIDAKFCKNDGVNLLTSKTILVPKPIPPTRTKEMWIKEGQALYGQRQYTEALAAYEQALLLDPHYAIAHFYRGNVFYALRRYSEALICYEQALQFNPNHPAAACHKGHTLRHLQRYPEALVAYEQSLQLGSSDVRAHAYNGKGRVLYDLMRYSEALAAYEQALLLHPNYAEPYVNKGNVFYALTQYLEAISAYEQASRLDPQYAAPYFFKGNALTALSRYAEALIAYENAIRLNPQYAAAYHGKGRVYEMMGLAAEAQAAFTKVASLNATF